MVESAQWGKVLRVIEKANSIVLTTHFNPDGDALGSEIALERYLTKLNKNVWIINNSPVTNNYKFLDPENRIIVFDAEKHLPLIEKADVFIIVDISDWERLRELGAIIQKSDSTKICIDHHHIENQFADIDIIYKEASSTGELIYEFLNYANHEIDIEIASALYTCILTDTGSFRFSNTTALTHEIASKLRSTGINARYIYQEVYENNSRNKIALMAKALDNLKYECSGKLAWFTITQQMFEETAAENWDTEGFPEIPRTIEGVEVSLMFTELEPDKVKVSFRSKGNIVINEVARKFGGGGHNFAAGAVIRKSLDKTIDMILSESIEVVNSYGN
ncbi:bifunctional oligoribonuclease/PAP phosphatase NrnA [candidate division KSB1 bacterium]|nr:bifunctional oligoribonuclease/PAP phosphatase NrnA [candidate division KSB1 bacterium]